MIKQVQLASFKGFRNFAVPFESFTNLVGLNSRGKTTVLQAIKLTYDLVRLVFGNEERPNFGGHISWESNPLQVMQQYSPHDPDAMWLNRNTAHPCRIILNFDADLVVDAHIHGRNRYTLDIKQGGRSLRGSALGDKEKAIISEILGLRTLYVPPIGATSPSENFMPKPNMLAELQQGRIAEVFRNRLYWFHNDGQKGQFERVIGMVQRYIPDSRLTTPRLSPDNPPRALLEFEEGNQYYDISLSGAGLRTLVNLASVLLLSESKLLLIDEPDAHLHSSLQRGVAQMLQDHVTETGVQVIAATHAPDFIDDVPTDSLVWIDRADSEGRKISDLGKALVDLGTVPKSDVMLARGATSVLFIEGTLDRKVLGAFFVKAGLPNPFDRQGSVIVTKLVNGKSTAKAIEHLPRVLSELVRRNVKVVALCDRDYELDDGENNNSIALILPRKEIENFLLDPILFAAAAKQVAESRQNHTGRPVCSPTEDEVKTKLEDIVLSKRDYVRTQVIWRFRERLPSSLAAPTKEQQADEWFDKQWSKPDWRLAVAPGKEVLGELRKWLSEEYHLTLTATSLVSAFSDVPPDLKTILARVIEELQVVNANA